MTEFSVTVDWQRDIEEPVSKFLTNKYSRGHSWYFDGGAVIKAPPSQKSTNCPIKSVLSPIR